MEFSSGSFVRGWSFDYAGHRCKVRKRNGNERLPEGISFGKRSPGFWKSRKKKKGGGKEYYWGSFRCNCKT